MERFQRSVMASLLAAVAFVTGLRTLVAAESASPMMALDEHIIAGVNANPASTWTAGRNPRFDGVSLAEAKQLLGVLSVDAGALPRAIPTRSRRNPINFDSREEWPGCVGGIRNQLRCGGCWAFAAAEVLSDRFCIASKGAVNVSLSAQDLISCGHVRTPPKYLLGCNGGVPEYAWKYLESVGIGTIDCIPFIGNSTEACPAKCATAGGTMRKYKVAAGSSRLLNSASSAAQQYLSQTGPIQAVFTVFHDFFAYKGGVYKPSNKSAAPLGKHSVKIVGYGIDNGENYWLAANSWGTSFGMDGYFKIGECECGITSEMTLGTPAL